MTNKERYASIGTWVDALQKELGVKLNECTFYNRARILGIVGQTAKDRRGRLQYNSYYSESDIRKVYAELLESKPQPDNDGFIRLEGEVFGTIKNFSALFGVSCLTIKKRLTGEVAVIEGRDSVGQLRDYYAESDVRRCCSDVLKERPTADADGVIYLEGERYSTISGFARLFGVSCRPIKKRVVGSSPFILGKPFHGPVSRFYREADVRVLCQDLLGERPSSDDGFIRVNGRLFGTIAVLARALELDAGSIRRRVLNRLTAFRGRDISGNVRDSYEKDEVQRICADLIAKKSKK